MLFRNNYHVNCFEGSSAFSALEMMQDPVDEDVSTSLQYIGIFCIQYVVYVYVYVQ